MQVQVTRGENGIIKALFTNPDGSTNRKFYVSEQQLLDEVLEQQKYNLTHNPLQHLEKYESTFVLIAKVTMSILSSM